MSASEIYRTLGRLETLIKGIGEQLFQVTTTLEHLDQRTSHIERQIYLWKGALSVLLLLSTTLGAFFGKLMLQ